MRIIRRDKSYYAHSGGGVTVSGGEPLMQPDFTRVLLKACRGEHIHTAIETCGYAPWGALSALLPYTDLIFYDLKQMDAEKHLACTGRDNALILANLEKLDGRFTGEIIVRIPFVPGYNDDMETQEAIYRHVARLKRVARIEIMPYHRLGEGKYTGLGRAYDLKGVAPVKKQDLSYLTELGEKCGVRVRIDAE